MLSRYRADARVAGPGYQVKQKTQFSYELWRSPERRLTLSSSANSQAAAYGPSRDSL